MLKFEVGNLYACRSICDHNCIWIYKVLKRTESTITIQSEGKGEKPVTKRINKKVSEWYDAEAIYPLGNYSMAPILSADKSAFKVLVNN